jgi:uncharacterized Rossmann fold enzyme
MQELAKAIDVRQFGAAEQHQSAIRTNLGRKLPEVTPAICSHDGSCVVVGSGPSLSLFIEDLKQEQANGRPIIAVKGAHDYLMSQGITPDIFVSLEPRDRSARDLKHKNDTTIYLLASRCSPDTFEHLKDCKVMLWHSASHDTEMEALKEGGVKMMVGGGTTSGLRALNLFYMLGFRKFVMYGFDSCLDENLTKRVDGSKAGQTIDVIMGGRRFVCNYAMAQQAQDFQTCYQMLPGATFEVKGDGLIAWIIAERKKAGKRT